MLAWVAIKLLFVLSSLEPAQAALTEKEASEDLRWLRLYQYEKTWTKKWKSDISTANYFFDSGGPHNPGRELRTAIEAYSDPSRTFGVQKSPAACVFPARKIILEKLLDRQFPNVDCPDLREWVGRIGADHINLVFVGAYPGNPASILGHTFLRFANKGSDLLNYSVGYMAVTDPRDSRLTYMVRGMTGGYDGFYEIEPHYMKVGLYNNSESRDLWELTLKLTPEEVDLLILHFWELTFNSKSPYFFIDENCSYRLIQFLEAIRPDLDITSKFSLVVLPAETVRAVIRAGMADTNLKFRPSIKRRLAYKLSLLDKDLKAQTIAARDSVAKTKQINDPTAIDTLLDHWLYENYRAKASLPREKSEIMEATYAQAATIKGESKFKGVTNDQVKEKFDLTPPFMGHTPSWLQIDFGEVSTSGHHGGFKIRNGAHPLWSNDPGYADAAAIEYLGAEIDWREDQRSRWSLLLIDVKSLSPFSLWERDPSWTFSINLKNHCPLCLTENPQAHFNGGAGVTLKQKKSFIYLMAHMEAAVWTDRSPQGLLAPGFLAGLRIPVGKLELLLETSQHWWKNRDLATVSLTTHLPFIYKTLFVFNWRSEDGRLQDFESTTTTSLTKFF